MMYIGVPVRFTVYRWVQRLLESGDINKKNVGSGRPVAVTASGISGITLKKSYKKQLNRILIYQQILSALDILWHQYITSQIAFDTARTSK